MKAKDIIIDIIIKIINIVVFILALTIIAVTLGLALIIAGLVWKGVLTVWGMILFATLM